MIIAGQAVLITGGGGGLGAGTARMLASAGARVAILDNNMDAATSVAKEIGGIAIECDVANETSGADAVEKARSEHGPARILVNCAGIAPAEKIVGKDGAMPLDNFRKVIEVNLVGSFNLMRLAASNMINLPTLDDNERGIIISTASVAAFEGQLGQAAYAASKGGIHSLTIVGAREFSRYGVRVNTIAPGIFDTPLMKMAPDKVREPLLQSTQFPHRFGEPAEFGSLAAHIVENTYLNGETIRLDSGMRMTPR